jgi:hypothetical protein
MDIFKQNKILIWLVIILVVINLGTLTGMWILNFSGKHHKEMSKPRDHKTDKKMREPGRFEMFGHELKFDAEQNEKYDEISTGHHKEMQTIADSINEKKKQILTEITKPEPDIAKVEILFTEIGKYQSFIEKEIFNHFLKIKMLCNDEQKIRFYNLIKDIIDRNKITPPLVPPPDKR